jgi:hypothetical protein
MKKLSLLLIVMMSFLNAKAQGKDGEMKFDPCCPPWNKELLKQSMKYKGSGSINDPYTLNFVPTTQFKNQMQAYLNYLYSLNPAYSSIVIEFVAHDQGAIPPTTGYISNPVGGTHYVTWTNNTTGVGNPTNIAGIYSGFPFQVNRWYFIHTGIYHSSGPSFFPFKCAENDIWVRISVQNSMKAANSPTSSLPAGNAVLEISNGKKIIDRINIDINK